MISSHRAARFVNISVLPQTVFEAMRVSGFPVFFAMPGTTPEYVSLAPGMGGRDEKKSRFG
jgi:hypothetical protein